MTRVLCIIRQSKKTIISILEYIYMWSSAVLEYVIGYRYYYDDDDGWGYDCGYRNGNQIWRPVNRISRLHIDKCKDEYAYEHEPQAKSMQNRQTQHDNKREAMHGNAMGSVMEINTGKTTQGKITYRQVHYNTK